MQRKSIRILILCTALALPHCDGESDYQLRGKGLSRTDAGALLWTWNVGVLNDSQFPELQRSDVQPVLDEVAAEAARLLPGLKLHFLADQPMNALFLMERTIRADDYLAPRTEAHGPVLRLHGDDAARATNLEKLAAWSVAPAARRALLERMTALQKAPLDPGAAGEADPRPGQGCLHQKPAASAHVWRSYIEEQVRYDLILTNALIFEDDLRRYPGDPQADSESRTNTVSEADGAPEIEFESPAIRPATIPENPLRWMLPPAPGRTAIEGSGALHSWNDWLAPESCLEAAGRERRSSDKLRVELLRAVLALAFPAPRAALVDFDPSSIPAGESFPEYAARRLDCADCPARWERRKQYLGAVYDFMKGGGEAACAVIEAGSAAGFVGTPADAAFLPEGDRLSAIEANRRNLLRDCGRAPAPAAPPADE